MSLLFQQLFEQKTSTYTYILADSKSREAVIVDPVLETVERDLHLIEELNLRLLYILETHIHADHVTGAGKIAKATGAKIALSAEAKAASVDFPLNDGDEILIGEQKIKVLETPGHTDSCLCYFLGDRVLTGDTLLIRGSGRTDFQDGSAEKIFRSVREKLFSLPDETLVYPAHDYRGFTSSTIGDEKMHNPKLGRKIDKSSFFKITSEFKLAKPSNINVTVPANLNCGRDYKE